MSHRARNIVKRADVRVGQGRHRTRFAIESFAELRIVRQAARQNLDGEACVPARLTCSIDLSHTSAPSAARISYGRAWLRHTGSSFLRLRQAPL